MEQVIIETADCVRKTGVENAVTRCPIMQLSKKRRERIGQRKNGMIGIRNAQLQDAHMAAASDSPDTTAGGLQAAWLVAVTTRVLGAGSMCAVLPRTRTSAQKRRRGSSIA